MARSAVKALLSEFEKPNFLRKVFQQWGESLAIASTEEGMKEEGPKAKSLGSA